MSWNWRVASMQYRFFPLMVYPLIVLIWKNNKCSTPYNVLRLFPYYLLLTVSAHVFINWHSILTIFICFSQFQLHHVSLSSLFRRHQPFTNRSVELHWLLIVDLKVTNNHHTRWKPDFLFPFTLLCKSATKTISHHLFFFLSLSLSVVCPY